MLFPTGRLPWSRHEPARLSSGSAKSPSDVSLRISKLYGFCQTGATEWYDIRKTGQVGRLVYDPALLESNQLALPKFWIKSTPNSSGFPRNWFNSTHSSYGFPRNGSNQLVTQANNIYSESTHDSVLRWIDVWHWFEYICAQLTFSKCDAGPAEWRFILLR